MGSDRSSNVASERAPGESLFQKAIAERRIAEKLNAERRRLIEERRRRYGPDGSNDAADDEAFFRRVRAEAFFRRVASDRAAAESADEFRDVLEVAGDEEAWS
jgi:hypothetical protein